MIFNNKGALKKHLLLFLIFGIIISIGIIAYSLALPSNQYTLNGNSVEWENSAGKIVVTPHTIQGVSGCQVINVTNKLGASKNVDILFRLKDDSNIKPKSAELYQPHTLQTENSLICNSANYGLIDSSTAWCNETVLINANSTWLKSGTYWTHAFDRYTTSGNSATLFWNTTENSNWLDVSKTVTKQSHSTGMLYYWTNVNFDASEEKSLRICMDTLPTLNTPSEKFDVCLKYTEDTFDTALDTGRYVCIDPWFDSSYPYKISIATTHSSSGILNNFTYLVNGTNGFTLGNGTNQIIWVNDVVNNTNFIYYIDDFNYTFTNSSENARLCYDVEYGNVTRHDTCAYSNDIEAVYTFENIDGTTIVDRKGTNNASWLSGSANFSKNNLCKYGSCVGLDGTNSFQANSLMFQGTTSATISMWFYPTNSSHGRMFFQGNDLSGAWLIAYTGTGASNKTVSFQGYIDGSPTSIAGVAYNQWHHIAWACNSSGHFVYFDGILNKTSAGSNCFDDVPGSSKTTFGQTYTTAGEFYKGYIDDVRAYKRVLTSPEVKRLYEQNWSVLGESVAFGLSETGARAQITSSITNSLPLANIYTDQQIYVRYLNGTQSLGTFDKVAVYGNQRWAFNYINASGENYTRMDSISPSLFVWENESLSVSQINTQITALISSTLAS